MTFPDFTDSRFCYYIPADGYIEDHGYRVSIVIEGESGHFPTGTWPYEGKPGQNMPYFWGEKYEEAKAVCVEMNAQLGLSEQDAFEIVTSSMRGSGQKTTRGDRRWRDEDEAHDRRREDPQDES